VTLPLAALVPGHRLGPAQLAVTWAGRRNAPRRLVQLLLVALTVLGVAALHTIGHAGAEPPDAAGTPSPAVAVIVPVLAAVVPAAVAGSGTSDDGCDGDGCTHQIAQPDRDRHGPSWWEVCLAVLSALASASLAIGVLLRLTRTRMAEAAPEPRRPPPVPLGAPAGLNLADIAVLRI